MIGKVTVTASGYDPDGPPVNDPTLGPGVKCVVVDCDNPAVCVGPPEDGYPNGCPCCDEHCGHDGAGSESCVPLRAGEGE